MVALTIRLALLALAAQGAVIQPESVVCGQLVPLEIPLAGAGTEVRAELWQVGPDGLERGLVLRPLEREAGWLRAEVPPGAAPGRYQLRLVSPEGAALTDRALVVEAPEGPPVIAEVRPFLITAGLSPEQAQALSSTDGVAILADHPTRVAVAGAGMDRLQALWLEGPSRVELRDLTPQHACRLLASVPPGLPEGRYRLKARTIDGRTLDGPELRAVALGRGEALFCFLVLFGGLGAVFALGLVFAWRAGEVGLRSSAARRNLAWQLGGLLLYLMGLGVFQFVLSDWVG